MAFCLGKPVQVRCCPATVSPAVGKSENQRGAIFPPNSVADCRGNLMHSSAFIRVRPVLLVSPTGKEVTRMTSTVRRAASAAMALAFIASAQVASSPTAQADAPTPAQRWCKRGEGQSVVIDFSRAPKDKWPDNSPSDGVIVRCNPGAKYDSSVEGDGRTRTLAAVDISYVLHSNGIVDSINHIPSDAAKGAFWMYITLKNPDSGSWDGGGWLPEPIIDTAVGVTWGALKPKESPRFAPES